MEKTSTRLKREKIYFFAKRATIYSSFLVFVFGILPYIQDYAAGRIYWGLVYCLYLMGIFYLVGREVDHRLKIYFRTNSSIDRMFYRVISGYLISGLIAYLFSFIPFKFHDPVFWIFWATWGILYSWPTRAKVLKEPFLKQVSEFRYLDKFEKLLVFLCTLLVLISIPLFQEVHSLDVFVLNRDPEKFLHPVFWKSVDFLFHPVSVMGIAKTTTWFMFVYFMSCISLLLSSYCLLRFFFNRRLSLLGIFSIISSWGLVLIFESDPIYGALISSFSVLWLWGLLWAMRSATYRSGLFMGLLSAYGYILYVGNLPFFFIAMALGWFVLFKEKTTWFKKQFIKYNLLGASVLLLLAPWEQREFPLRFHLSKANLLQQWDYNFFHKDFYVLSVLGLLLIIVFSFNFKSFADRFNVYNRELFGKLLYCLSALVGVSLICAPQNISYINTLWMMTFLSLVPLEWLFQAVRRLRSKSNIIYGIYIVICLLDSRIEGRIKNIVKFLDF